MEEQTNSKVKFEPAEAEIERLRKKRWCALPGTGGAKSASRRRAWRKLNGKGAEMNDEPMSKVWKDFEVIFQNDKQYIFINFEEWEVVENRPYGIILRSKNNP